MPANLGASAALFAARQITATSPIVKGAASPTRKANIKESLEIFASKSLQLFRVFWTSTCSIGEKIDNLLPQNGLPDGRPTLEMCIASSETFSFAVKKSL